MAITLVGTTTVGAGGAANITFSSIPQTGKDILLLVSARGASGNNPQMLIQLNGSSATNYRHLWLLGNGSSVTSATFTTQDEWKWEAGLSSSSQTTSSFSQSSFCIPNYTSANAKIASTDSVTGNNTANNNAGNLAFTAGLWALTSAVTSIRIRPDADSFAQHSTASLYIIS